MNDLKRVDVDASIHDVEYNESGEFYYADEVDDVINKLNAQIEQLTDQYVSEAQDVITLEARVEQQAKVVDVLADRLEDSLCHEDFTAEQWKLWAEAKAGGGADAGR